MRRGTTVRPLRRITKTTRNLTRKKRRRECQSAPVTTTSNSTWNLPFHWTDHHATLRPDFHSHRYDQCRVHRPVEEHFTSHCTIRSAKASVHHKPCLTRDSQNHTNVMIWLIIAACLIAWLFTFLPAIAFLTGDWKTRFDNLVARFNDEAIKLYLAKFFPSEELPTTAGLEDYFSRRMKSHYGRKQFLLPILLWMLTSGLAIVLIARSVLQWLGLAPELLALPPIAASALLGAFMWTANDLVFRSGTGDLTPRDIYTCCYRFLIAVPMGYCLAFTVNEDVGIPLAFFLGTFPSDTLMRFGRRFVAKRLDIADEPANEKSELELLQGINRPEADRFREEGITTVLQLAYTDPVATSLRTNFDFNYVTDVMSQALLWIYLDKDINLHKLRALGLRGAYEAKILALLLQSSVPTEKQIGEKNLTEVAKILGVDDTAFRKTLLEVAADPYTAFLFNLWNA